MNEKNDKVIERAYMSQLFFQQLFFCAQLSKGGQLAIVSGIHKTKEHDGMKILQEITEFIIETYSIDNEGYGGESNARKKIIITNLSRI